MTECPAPVLTIADLCVTRPSFRVELPELQLEPGDAAALVGRSGSGKSTLLRAIVGRSRRSHEALEVTGRIAVQGRDWPPARDREWREALRASVAWLPQDPVAALDPVARIGGQLERLCGRVGTPALVDALARLGVDRPEAILRRYPHQISGGEAQRVWLASAWLRRPALLLADEPTASLDGLRIGEWVQALGTLRDQVGCAAVVATHDLDLVDSLAARPFVARPLASTSGFGFEPGDVGKPEWPVRSATESPVEPAVLALDGVSVRVGRAQLIEGIDFEVCPGESVAIQGPSGAGKTTVAKVLAAHRAPTTGRRRFDGPRTGVQLLFQNAYQSLTPGRTIRWLVEEVATPTFDVQRVAAEIGLADRLDGDRESLSGGERRRAALLRCLAVQPQVLVLDEPTASLDHDSAAEVVRAVLDQQAATGMALVWITHDAALARCVADRFLSMLGGRLHRAVAVLGQ